MMRTKIRSASALALLLAFAGCGGGLWPGSRGSAAKTNAKDRVDVELCDGQTKTTIPRAPRTATKLDNRSTSSSRSAKPPAWNRLEPSNR